MTVDPAEDQQAQRELESVDSGSDHGQPEHLPHKHEPSERSVAVAIIVTAVLSAVIAVIGVITLLVMLVR